jgi:hypothetical protein
MLGTGGYRTNSASPHCVEALYRLVLFRTLNEPFSEFEQVFSTGVSCSAMDQTRFAKATVPSVWRTKARAN